jgi:hypothetical protein
MPSPSTWLTDLRNVTDELGSLLGIHGLGEAGRANDIGEQRRHWPAFTGRSS